MPIERTTSYAQPMSKEIASPDDRARELLNLVAAGNLAAYEELYRLVSRRVYAFARRMIENAESADEVMVDTMYEVWRTAGRFRGDSKVSTWILGIARNKVLMVIRSGQGGQHEDIADFAEVLDAEVPDGFALLAEKEMRELIRRCIERLSEKHRECIHLVHFEDMTMQEVAAVQAVPEGTVKSRLSHARAQVGACIENALNKRQSV
jgi:RNA polymerase sigma-70 factor, ECF subfamily